MKNKDLGQDISLSYNRFVKILSYFPPSVRTLKVLEGTGGKRASPTLSPTKLDGVSASFAGMRQESEARIPKCQEMGFPVGITHPSLKASMRDTNMMPPINSCKYFIGWFRASLRWWNSRDKREISIVLASGPGAHFLQGKNNGP